MRYFYLKIDSGNAQAREWLSGKNPLNRPAAVVYCDNLGLSDYRKGLGKNQPKDFYTSGLAENRNNTTMVVIHDCKIWFLKPAGEVQFQAPVQKDGWELTPKIIAR